jgi:hypothetical protein
LRKKGVIKSLGKEITHIERSERSSEELYKFILKILQNLRIDGWTEEKEIWALYDTVLTLNR